jgi:transposase
MQKDITKGSGITIGMDLGDRTNRICVLDAEGQELEKVEIPNTARGIDNYFSRYTGVLVALEAGTHSPWISRKLEKMGHRVLVGNPRRLRVIWRSPNKSDMRDAEMLARIGRLDPKLMYPIHHRSEQAHSDLELIKSRGILVRVSSQLVNHERGAVKATGVRIPKCSLECFHKKAPESIPQILKPTIEPLLETIEDLSGKIKECDRKIEELSKERYRETERLLKVKGVGPVTALAFVLTLEEPDRFQKSRSVGAYLGLTPRRDQSGETDKQLRITKAGDTYLRQLLVNCVHYIMGPFGEESDLREYGMRIASRGGKNAKRRAVVAVSRKLAVLLHHLWVSGEAYIPLHKTAIKKMAA